MARRAAQGRRTAAKAAARAGRSARPAGDRGGGPAPRGAPGGADRARASTELEQRLADLLRGGLAGAEQAGYAAWEETAARMVDAQAPGLAARVRELGAIPGSGPGLARRGCWRSARCCTCWTGAGWAASGCRRALAATVRSRVGLTVARRRAPPVRDRWLVLAQYDTAYPTAGSPPAGSGCTAASRAGRRCSCPSAPPAAAPGLALPVGLVLDAEASAYPAGPAGLRADLGERFAAAAPYGGTPAGRAARARRWTRTARRCATTPGWSPGR